MEKKHIIYVHGALGSGKSTTSQLLADRLGYERFSAGYFFRQEAEDRGMTFVEFHELLKVDQSIDKKIDNAQKEYMETHDKLAFDGRVGFILMGQRIFNVYLNLDERVAAERMLAEIQSNPERSVQKARSVEQLIEDSRHRLDTEILKLKRLYDVEDITDLSHYHLVVDTTDNSPDQVVDIIVDAYNKWLEE